MEKLISAVEARARFDAAFRQEIRVERIATVDALGRVLAEAITSPLDLPPFARALMDGYAVRAAETAGASREAPRHLTVVDDVAMGAVAARPIGPGEAARIPTGGMLPEGADAVVNVEETAEGDGRVAIYKVVRPGQHAIERAEDVSAGEPVMEAGRRLRPPDIGALMGLGILEVVVYTLPRVGILSTGDEIVSPEEIPPPGKIRDMNSYSLAASVRRLGAIPVLYGIIQDDLPTLAAAARRALDACDVLILNGGSSVGVKDHVAPAIATLGSPGVLVHGIDIRPGKPTVLAVCDGKPVFGLPGQPVSVLNTFDQFVAPVLRRMLRVPDETRVVRARLTRDVASADGREDHVRVTLEERENGWWATPIPGVSAMISTMVRAAGITVIASGSPGWREGDEVEVRLFD